MSPSSCSPQFNTPLKEKRIMFWIFSARKPAPRNSRPLRTRLEVESLQERVLPSASPLAHHDVHAVAVHGHAGKAHQHFTFALTGSTHAKGRAEVQVVDGK